VSKRTFGYLGQFTWNRVLRWLRRKHPKASWGWLRRRYLPRWWPTHGNTELLRCGQVTPLPLPLPRRADSHAVGGDRVNQQPSDMGLGRAGCGGTRTSGSEVRAEETGRRKRRHRAPARPYSLSWLSCWRRLTVRWDRDSGRWFAFVLLACAVVCFKRL
jgi:hypothetical protein